MPGVEWIVEGYGCSPDGLRDLSRLRTLFRTVIDDLGLHVVGEILWHQFPHPGGITGLALLSESHLTCHTFPEHGSICLNLFSCRPRPRWDFESRLRQCLGAEYVCVRDVARSYLPAKVGA
ncbi:MAG TPA: S-adenosylmethionine decarboxylase [Bryobacteraceae bacterium]|nr:S-adenosylmethionine decarboxylase [Bryobacteraceae bacterium]